MNSIRTILIANRGEIAIRVMRAASEMGIRTVAIYAEEDKHALHRFKADESYCVGQGKKPIAAYLDIADIIRIAKQANVDAIHPGYGFLSENPEFAEACAEAGIQFIGPKAEVMRQLGNKVMARNVAVVAGVPVVPATGALPADLQQCQLVAAEVGYPLMLKASWGGGGRGMRVVEHENELQDAIEVARREAKAAFGNDEVYLEKLVRRARHVEVQIMGDRQGNIVHLFERDCTVQRRNQKVVERAPAPYLDDLQRHKLCEAALRLARAVGYTHAGTVEFLMDADTEAFYFIEVNPRIQVEHTVTEEVTGIDIVKAQIQITEGICIGSEQSYVPQQEQIKLLGHALQCRLTTEDPKNGFMPDYGRLTAFRSATGFGVRVDSGTAYTGAVVTPYYDSLLAKVTVRGMSSDEANNRMVRALKEFRIRGVSNNLAFLENVITHPLFTSGQCTTRFIDTTPELFELAPKQDRATRLLEFLGNITVNGNPEMQGRQLPTAFPLMVNTPDFKLASPSPMGTRDQFKLLGAEGFSQWMLEQKRVLITDTTMRDAHQSLFATRMRSADMLAVAPYYSQMASELFSLECWGGATFDVAMRFLKEDPWERLAKLREAIPNILFQMLLRSSNAVGYTNYADNVVQHFIAQAAKGGIDLFRVFDSLNAVDNMRVAIDAVRESGMLCETAICYTSDIHDNSRRYNLKYYVEMAKQLEKAGANILAIKDMAGICKPNAARELIRVLKEETGLPVHFHTHDTSGIAAASILAAIDAGVDVVDTAMDAMSGLTSQPSMGSIVAALKHTERDSGLNPQNLQQISTYWEDVRRIYAPFEADMRAGTADVYHHEMPGGQYTNLREQARSLGLEHRWSEVSDAYAQVNLLFGDIVKVTPTSKVVGDMALFMVSNHLTAEDISNPALDIDFPESVVSLFKGELGTPAHGFPVALQQKVLKGTAPLHDRPGAIMPAVNLAQQKQSLRNIFGDLIDDQALASYLMYPKVFNEFMQHKLKFGTVSTLPSSAFFYGLKEQETISVELEAGKTLEIKLLARSEARDGWVDLFIELNGQLRLIQIEQQGTQAAQQRPQADPMNPAHLGASMPGMISTMPVKTGQSVLKGETLFTIEAMKMELAIKADSDCVIQEILVSPGMQVKNKDLVLVLQ
ncbi:pyruvate carboxylase [Acinetobacter vivianii]|uniref:pyruvate carboxylase n=1 Tax=Acinetobacter vivianii TaxID=1776742 RepID=UPI002DB65E71|nr:pyruvate carboxylase [Acinetobacter vivianii]MEB6478873.1 pyruvate carboxylase [Acinetobacter vivianii]MEB6657295.1 pyruvate carboxylase [Acinetobacter vivianii]